MKIKNALTETHPLGSQETELSIDKGSEVFLMSALTNLYTTPLSAVFREVFANAVDANAQAGAPRPVEVTVKTVADVNTSQGLRSMLNGGWQQQQSRLAETHVYDLTVRDYGSGMTRADLENVYSKYGASTKRDSNKQIGGFGLGAKSPLAITDEFSGFTIQGGHEIHFTIRSRQGASAVLSITHEKKSSLPDGTSITIPIKHGKIPINRTAQPADLNVPLLPALSGASGYGTLQTIDKGVALLNGKDITEAGDNVHASHEPIRGLDGRILGWIRKSPSPRNYRQYHGNRTTERINYGIITYSHSVEENKVAVEEDQITGRGGRNYYHSASLPKARHAPYEAVREIIVNVPLGALELPPSRDSIIMSSKSKTAIASARSLLDDTVKSLYETRLQNQETLSDAILFAYEHRDIIGREWSWRGKQVPAQLTLPALTPESGAENGTRWLDSETVSFVPTSLVAALNMSNVNARIGAHSYYSPERAKAIEAGFSPNYFAVGLAPETTSTEKFDKQQTMVRRLVRDYGRAIGSYDNQGGVLPRFVLVDPASVTAETREWLEAYKAWTDFDKMKEIVTKFRADKRVGAEKRKNVYVYSTISPSYDATTNEVTWSLGSVSTADKDDFSNSVVLGKIGSCYSSPVNDLSGYITVALDAEVRKDAALVKEMTSNAETVLKQDWVRELGRSGVERFILVTSSRNTNRLTTGDKKATTLPVKAEEEIKGILKGLNSTDREWVLDQLHLIRADGKGTLLNSIHPEDADGLATPALKALYLAVTSPLIKTFYRYGASAALHHARQDAAEELAKESPTLASSLIHTRTPIHSTSSLGAYRYTTPAGVKDLDELSALSQKAVQIVNLVAA